MPYVAVFGKQVFRLGDFQCLGNLKLGLSIFQWQQSSLRNKHDSFLYLLKGTRMVPFEVPFLVGELLRGFPTKER